MKKPKKRLLWLAITAIMVLMFAMSASAMAANELTVRYVDSNGTILATKGANLYEQQDSSNPYYYGYSMSVSINQAASKPGYTFTN
ncbi:MAG: hypothetical protein RR992_08445, partial [Clostridiales bacterium]